MRLSEYARWSAAWAGVLLWLAIAYVFAEGGTAKHLYRCQGRIFTGAFDDCFTDYIPILEVAVIPALIVLTTYVFARFALALFAPPIDRRTFKWRLAGENGAADLWPLLQIIACLGIGWSLWRLFTYPLARPLLPFHLYWGLFALWFACGALVGFLDERKSRSA